MTRLQLIAPDGRTSAPLHDDDARAALRDIGIECGCLPLHEAPVSSAPQLTYARELLALQRRFGSRRIERVRARRVPAEIPATDGDELCVVLQGSVHFGLEAGAHSASLSVEAGEWVALPAGLSRTALPVAQRGLDLLRLHAA